MKAGANVITIDEEEGTTTLGYQDVSSTATAETADASELSSTVAAGLASGTSATVTFSINQISAARSNAVYDMTLTATDLLLTKYSNGTAAPATLADNEKFTASTKTLAVGSAGASIKGAVLTNVEMATVSANDSTDVLTVTYKGVVGATTQAPKELGTYAVTWAGNADAVSGTYVATIKLNVEAK